MTRVYIPLLLVVALAVAAAGCGGGSNNSASAVTTTATTAADETGGDTEAESTTAPDEGRTIRGTVGPGFEIAVEGADNLSAGHYTLVVDDKSAAHNFHLTGPGGIDVSTDVAGEGEKSFELDLVPGTYTFVCDPHASSMKGSFTVH